MLLTLSLALLAQTPQTPLPPQSAGQHQPAPPSSQSQQGLGHPVLAPGQSAGGSLAMTVIETFEGPTVVGEVDTISDVLDETSILVDGQGPNLVLGNCSYTSLGGVVQFNGVNHFGQVSQNIAGFPASTLTIDYDYPQAAVSMVLSAYDGYPDTADVTAYDSQGNVVDTVQGINLPDGATRVPITLYGSGIVSIDVTSTEDQGWSPVIDDHVFQPESSAFETFEIASISTRSGFNMGLTSLDDGAVASNGQGPGLVEDGCTYSCPGGLWWNGDDYFGQKTQSIASMNGPLTLDYDYVQNGVSFTVAAYSGYPDSIDIVAYDIFGNALQSFTSVALPGDASVVPIEFTAQGIARVEIGNNNHNWAGNLDNHDYDDAPPSIDQFETYQLPAGGAEAISISEINSDTVINGQGPGLVARNVRYDAGSGNIQWNNRNYFGQSSKNVNSNLNGGLITIHYLSVQSSASFTLAAFAGYSDTATCTAYDIHGNSVDMVSGVSLPDGNPVPVSLTSPKGIARVEIQGTYSWSPLLDHSDFTGSDYGISMTISGPCPGVQTIVATGGRPGAGCKLMYSLKIGGSLIPYGICAGTPTELAGNIKLLPPLFRYDSNGETTLSNYTPPSACGKVFIQLVDQDCNISNVIAL